jgi:hypothetical protein
MCVRLSAPTCQSARQRPRNSDDHERSSSVDRPSPHGILAHEPNGKLEGGVRRSLRSLRGGEFRAERGFDFKGFVRGR